MNPEPELVPPNIALAEHAYFGKRKIRHEYNPDAGSHRLVDLHTGQTSPWQPYDKVVTLRVGSYNYIAGTQYFRGTPLFGLSIISLRAGGEAAPLTPKER